MFSNLLHNIISDESKRAFLYGKILALLQNDVSEIKFSSVNDQKNEVFLKIKNDDAIIYKMLPPIYPNVEFEMSVTKKEPNE